MVTKFVFVVVVVVVVAVVVAAANVVVVVDCCVDVCVGENVDVEKIMLFVVLTIGGIVVVPMVSTFVVVCSSGELQIYNVGSITVHDML